MTIKRTLVTLLVVVCVLGALPVPVFSDEGFWEFNAVPVERIEARYGVKLDNAFLRQLRRATVRLNNGGTGAIVSANGLLLTNQHVAQDYVQKISSAKTNYVKDGYVAREQSAELKLPEIELRVLEHQEDVTARVNGAVATGMSGAQANSARRRESADIVADRDKTTVLKSDVLGSFKGLKHTLYSYKVYTDVRLVFIPERDVANFGGDDDNYRYPRYWMDGALLRIYENDKPLRTENFLPLAEQGIEAKAPVIVSGYPITTERYLTVAHLEYLNRTELPLLIKRFQSQLAALRAFSALGENESTSMQTQLFDIRNTLKALEGRLQGLEQTRVLDRKRKGEQAWRQQFARQPNSRQFERAFAAIEKARQDLNGYEAERRLLDEAWGFETPFFRVAREHVRLAQEKAKPPNKRLPGFDDAFLARLENNMLSNAPKKSKFEEIKLANSLALMKDVLGEAHPAVKFSLAGKSPAERAAELISQTRLDDVSFRKSLVQQGLPGLETSTDPMIVVARWVDAEALRLRQRYQQEVVDVENEYYPVVEQALQTLPGETRYPDANFTLRLSVGQVMEYTENNKKVLPFTYFNGLFERAQQKNHKEPYKLPELWTSKRNTLQLKTPFNFVTTNDVVAGSSGSPVVNKNGELVGVIFDSNQHALVGRYLYDGERGRAIALDIRGLLVALKEVYGANLLLAELKRS